MEREYPRLQDPAWYHLAAKLAVICVVICAVTLTLTVSVTVAYRCWTGQPDKHHTDNTAWHPAPSSEALAWVDKTMDNDKWQQVFLNGVRDVLRQRKLTNPERDNVYQQAVDYWPEIFKRAKAEMAALLDDHFERDEIKAFGTPREAQLHDLQKRIKAWQQECEAITLKTD